jgi:hypothetical protein
MTTTTREVVQSGAVTPLDQERIARHRAAAARVPAGSIGHVRSVTGRNEYRVAMPPELLATFTAEELVDIADSGICHFGGNVTRDAVAGTADITVWID